ncbi:hypothetical protein [Vibrio rarus]|uniref:hypothetical protein n=1 Tax=Vibrio rarus TaxID=413403 RepID=UPI0021C34EB2|nr:hypothetical protein [Vibrio rarus]
MSELTPQQEQAIATFKTNMHFPGDGYHALIIELCKTYQLPFQKVRKALMSNQKAIEKNIRQQYDQLTEDDLTQQAWLNLVHGELKGMATHNSSLMATLQANANYIHALKQINSGINTEPMREQVLEALFLAYEKVMFKPLAAMLHTTALYWKLMRAEEIHVMTQEYRAWFSDYPQHMEVAAHLFTLQQQVQSLTL